MRVLIVANYKLGRFSCFVQEQINALKVEGIELGYFGVKGGGIFSYLSNVKSLKKTIQNFNPDLIHAHYGLCGFVANLQRKVPVITTYHGSDIHSKGWNLALSQLCIRLSAHNIFVSKKLSDISGTNKSKSSIIPCGIDVDTIQIISKDEAKRKINRHSPFVLFSGSFSNSVKNATLAKEAMNKIADVELLELDGFSRQEVNLLMNAADCLLLTSHREGSPQVIKEAMACGTPVVSVDVGDVKNVIGGIEGCFLAKYDADDIAQKIIMALAFKGKTKGRQRIMELGLDNHLLAKRIISIYEDVLKQKR